MFYQLQVLKEVYKMDTNSIVSIVSAVGFPIVAALGCAAFVKFQYTENSKQLESMRKEHREEVNKMTEALNNNTLALQRLVDKLGGDS